MSINDMKDYFTLLQDKYGSPYYTDDEIEIYLNRAQLDYISGLLPKDGGKLNVELNQNTIMCVSPLLFTTGSINMSASGSVLRTDINTAIETATSVDDAKLLRVLAIGWNGERHVSYTRKNNWYSYIANTFKAPSDSKPRVYEDSMGFVFKPIDVSVNLVFMGIRYPVTMSITSEVDCELPDIVHNEIISRALELAGVGSRDQLLAELQKINNV